MEKFNQLRLFCVDTAVWYNASMNESGKGAFSMKQKMQATEHRACTACHVIREYSLETFAKIKKLISR
ncbi:MAG: hypothetical protein V8Q36_10835 [Anaerotignum sp.]